MVQYLSKPVVQDMKTPGTTQEVTESQFWFTDTLGSIDIEIKMKI